MKLQQTAQAAALAAALSVPAHSQVADKTTLTLEGARRVLAAAEAEAKAKAAPGAVIAVVDDGGNLMALERLDGTFAAGANVSIGKARTAALFQRPTKVFEDLVNKGRTTMVALDDFTPLQGGVPIVAKGQIVGAVGVSGAASAQQDEELALAGAGALAGGAPGTAPDAPGSKAVVYIPADRVAAGFAKGMPLVEVAGYKVHASRREGPGQVEVHEADTDLIHVLTGSATFVTGGAVSGGKTIAPGEIRGASVEGGETRTLSPGDVVIVPDGVPHWFKEVPGPITYYVVKVPTGAAR